jgi:hypothetical protein
MATMTNKLRNITGPFQLNLILKKENVIWIHGLPLRSIGYASVLITPNFLALAGRTKTYGHSEIEFGL